MIGSLLLGLFFSKYAIVLKPYLMFVLSLMMTLSLQRVSGKLFVDMKKMAFAGVQGLVINYLIFGSVLMLIAALFFYDNTPIFIGFLFIAVSPPGVVIVPFVLKMKGDLDWSVVAVVSGYFASLPIIPLTFLLLPSDYKSMSAISLFSLLFWSVVAPFILSRFLRAPSLLKFSTHNGRIIDLLFFILIYTVVGVNNQAIQQEPHLLLNVAAVFVLALFGGVFVFGRILKKRRVSQDRIVASQLMFGVKNNGFSAIMAMSAGSAMSALPSMVLSVVLLIFLILFPFLIPREKEISD
jgi:bile acid:Na+ symporter, BASS family